MKEANRVAKNSLILYVRLVLTVFISLYSTRLVLAALGASDFGLFNVVGGAIAMLTFLNLAMSGATQRFMSYAQGQGDETNQKNIFNVSIALHFGIAVSIVLILEITGVFLFESILEVQTDRIDVAKLIYQFLIISTFFTIISVPYDAVINAHENMLFVAILGIIEAILKLVIALFITYTLYDKLITYGLLTAFLTILLLIIKRIYCRHKYMEARIIFKQIDNPKLVREMGTFAGWNFLSAASGMFANYGQAIVINMFFGTVVNAAQGVSRQVAGQLGAFANVMMKALSPVIAKSEGAGNRQMMIKASLMGSKFSFFMLMIFYIPVWIEMPYVFNFWLGQVPEFAIIFCRLQLIRNLVEQLFITVATSISAVGDIKHFKIAQSVLNFVPLAVTFILFKLSYPPYVMYIVFICYASLMGLVTLYYGKKLFNLSVSYFFSFVLFRCIAAFVLVFTISVIPVLMLPESFIRLLLVTSISTLLFFVIVWLIGFSQHERNSVKLIIGAKFPFLLKIL